MTTCEINNDEFAVILSKSDYSVDVYVYGYDSKNYLNIIYIYSA